MDKGLLSRRPVHFNGTQGVWEQLEQLPYAQAIPSAVVDEIRRLAEPIYRRKAAAGPASMRYLVAGLETDGSPAIRWLEFDTRNLGGVLGPCQIAALGTQPNIQEVANVALQASLKPFSNIVRLGGAGRSSQQRSPRSLRLSAFQPFWS
ncbi:hypothetical protein NJB95_04185 [Brucella intermedia]|uniref:hypothetical protein n=1 Tax=Brucella intermedia TaxID=94625 RepID=UPI00209B18C5|nr:hypothetical protein [Brucella intermedia]MCO7735803.1 hypothetical protein [Brucella intermedia]